MCRGPTPPTLPWATCLALGAPRHTIMAHRVPSIGPRASFVILSAWPSGPAFSGGPCDGPVAVRTLLASDRPWPPAGDVQDPEGVAFTAVSPFY